MLAIALLTSCIYSGFLCFGRLVRGQSVEWLTIIWFGVSVAGLASHQGWIQ